MARARRAKKSKMSKKLLTVMLLAIISFGIFEVSTNKKTSISTIAGETLGTYDASNFVKDTFTENSGKYLPVVYKNTYEKITKSDIDNDFKNYGMTVKSYSSDKLGTGTSIVATNGKEDYTYKLLIYGDVDCDGQVNVLDALSIVNHLLWGDTYSLSGMSRTAANVEGSNTDKIDVLDALRIIDFIVSEKQIIDKLPSSDIARDKTAPEISLNGEKEIILNVGEEYKEQGAVATDNLDPVINSRINTQGTVNTSKPDVYYVTYSVTDASGNGPVTVVRKVVVTDYIESITIDTLPKSEYVEGEKITLNGMIAYANWKYDKQKHDAINIENIEVSPETAVMGLEEVKIKYTYTVNADSKTVQKTVESSFPVEVTEKTPIITLTGHDDVRDLKLKVGDTYTEGATAYDELADENLKVTWVTKDEEENIVDEIDTSKPGKYTVEYTSEPSSVSNKPGTATRKVEIVDYITDIEFRTNGDFKKTYIDREIISYAGIETYAIYAYDTQILHNSPKLIETELSSNIVGSVNYDRNTEVNNVNRELIVTATVEDETGGEERKYTSNGITINVIKRVETIQTTSGTGIPSGGSELTPVTGEILQEIWVGRISSGPNEANITVDSIKTPKVLKNGQPVNEEQNGFTTYAVAKPVYIVTGEGQQLDRYVDIYFVGIQPGKYVIEVEPKESSEYTKGKQLYVETQTSNVVNHITYKFTKDEMGTGPVVNTFAAGETVYANLTFYHRYGTEEKYLDVGLDTASNLETPKVWERKFLSDGITETDPEEITEGITANYLPTNSAVIKITALPSAVLKSKSIRLSIASAGKIISTSRSYNSNTSN